MNNYDKVRLQRLVSDENGTNYHRNVPLDGYTITLGDSFISFAFREIKGVNIVFVHYMYITKKEELISLLAYCVNMWSGCGVKMIYYREHKRKANYTKLFAKLIDAECINVKIDKWKHKWTSTNGYDEADCVEFYTKAPEK